MVSKPKMAGILRDKTIDKKVEKVTMVEKSVFLTISKIKLIDG